MVIDINYAQLRNGTKINTIVEEYEMKETVGGTNIPIRDLTPEEANREITWQRFRDWHYEVGEDFLDQSSQGCGLMFAGYMMAVDPDNSSNILEVVNECRRPDVMDFNEIYGYDEVMDIEMLYVHFADFCNLTVALKYRVNQILIQVMEKAQ